MIPKPLATVLRNQLKLSKAREVKLRLEIASLEGKLAEAKADLAGHLEVIAYLDRKSDAPQK